MIQYYNNYKYVRCDINKNTHYCGTCPLTALGTGLSLRFVSD